MEILSIIQFISVVTLVIIAWKILNWIWFRPKKLEKLLRAQGFNGNSYKLLNGDLKELAKVIQDATSKPINLSDDIIPRALPFQYQLYQKYGAKYFHWSGPRPIVHIFDPQLVKEVFTKSNQFLKNEPHPMAIYLIQGIISHEGDKWAKQRKLLNPAFHIEKLKLMLPAFDLCCMEIVSKWENLVASSKGSTELDVWQDLQTLTSDAISRTAFGSSYEEGRKVFELQMEQTELYVMAMRSFYLPGMRFLPTKRNKRMKEIAEEVKGLITDVINKRIKAMKAGEARSDDLLGILLEAKLKVIEDHGNENSAMSIQDIMEECKLFYFAGQETTSALLVWTMVLLCQHPEWQERAREEVLQECGYEKPGFEALNKLKIVTMILYEVLRLYPPVAATGRRTTEEMKLGNLTLPSGIEIQLPILFLHRDIELWGPDAKDFKPERFSEGVLKATKGKPSFFPFGGGPRICIAQNFGLMEAKVAMVMILQRFSFELSPSYAHTPCNKMILQPQYEAHIILHKI